LIRRRKSQTADVVLQSVIVAQIARAIVIADAANVLKKNQLQRQQPHQRVVSKKQQVIVLRGVCVVDRAEVRPATRRPVEVAVAEADC